MSSEFLGLRLNPKKHKDIITWLNRFDDKSEEARRLMDLGIRVSNGRFVEQRITKEPLVWSNIPKEPSIRVKETDVVANILNSFS